MPDIQTKQDYAEYEKSIADFTTRQNITFLSTGTNESGEDSEQSEPWFSCRSCECCGSNLGGMREYLYAEDRNTGKLAQFEICEDCVYYVNYGRLDDTTMMRVEESARA